ncbi:MAG: hypothetical protein QOI11_698 [Candidatus Eremiobacteraeota bacterium]|jgi:hypothetical protein|nr:hypothetical protein [Candidatus Eremiobacteraeota bacterium]
MESEPRTPTDDEIETVDGTVPADDDRLDEAILAADDTGMLAGERMITLVELEEGDSGAGDV